MGFEGSFEVGVNSDNLCVDQLEDRIQTVGIGGIESGDVVVDAELGNHPKGVLKKNDIIHFKVNEKDKWTAATILGRAGKSTGKHKSWYNVCNHVTGVDHSLDLDNVKEWRKNEEVNLVLIPRPRHEDEDCVEAKKVELEKLKSFGVYQEVDDEGQERLFTTWVLWNISDEVCARIVERGYEEDKELCKDSSTVEKKYD